MPVIKKRIAKVTPSASSSTKSKSCNNPKSSKIASNSITDPRSSEVKCLVCDQEIIEGKDEALFCEGVCNGWYHRYCAGVSIVHFQRLSTSTESFFCYECSSLRQNSEIQDLKKTINTLKEEIDKLKIRLEDRCPCSSAHDLISPPENPVSNVGNVACVKLGKRGGQRRSRERYVAGQKSKGPSKKMEQNSDESTMRKSNQKIRVEGVRRVWGTLKETTASSLKSTIMKFSPSATLFVKRKTVRNDAGEIKTWWYVLHDSEEVLKVLEEKWEGLQMHTGWKLELCFRPHHATDSVKPMTTS